MIFEKIYSDLGELKGKQEAIEKKIDTILDMNREQIEKKVDRSEFDTYRSEEKSFRKMVIWAVSGVYVCIASIVGILK